MERVCVYVNLPHLPSLSDIGTSAEVVLTAFREVVIPTLEAELRTERERPKKPLELGFGKQECNDDEE